MNSQELFVSIDANEYRKNKANLLSSEVDLLNIMKHLQHLAKIRQDKNNVKIEMHNLFSSILQDLKNLQSNLPKPKLPKAIQNKTSSAKDKEQPLSIFDEEKTRSIDNELLEIRAKLKQLNS